MGLKGVKIIQACFRDTVDTGHQAKINLYPRQNSNTLRKHYFHACWTKSVRNIQYFMPKLKGNWYISREATPSKLVLPPFWNWVLPKRNYFLLDRPLFRRDLVWKKGNRKSQTLFPLFKLAENLSSLSSSFRTRLFLSITKTCLFKYIENFTSKSWKFSNKQTLIFFIFLLKT